MVGCPESVIYSLSFSPFYDITVNLSCVSALRTRGFAPGACSRFILHGQYKQVFILRELAPCYGTHEGPNGRNLVWDSWYSPDEHLGTSSKLNMATSLWSRTKQKKLILLMMMRRWCLKMTPQLVTEKVASKAWARLWPLRRQEKGAFKLVFENCPWKIQTDFVKTRELQTQNSSSSTFTLSVDAMLIFEHESRVPKEL